MVTIVSPLIIRTTIDSIIGSEPIGSNFLERLIQYIGGRAYLRKNLWIIGVLLVFIAVLRGILLYFRNTLASKTAENTAKNIRDSLYDQIQRLPYEYHVKAETGDLIQRCTSDVNTIKRFLSIQLVEVAGSLFMLGFVSYTMFKLNVKMTLVSMATMPIIFIFAFIFFSKVKKAFEASDEAEAELTTVLQENLTGVRVVKACANQKYEIEKFDEKNKDYRDKTYKLIQDLALYWGASDFICFIQIGLTIVFGSIWAVAGEISLGTVMAFSTYVNMLLWPIRQMGRTLTDMGKAIVSIGRIEEIFNENIEILNGNNEKPEIKGNIEFENVYFEYEKNTPVIDNISFSVKAGSTVAIIGPTGSGKSSLVYLLARLYDYNRGSILIDGKELKDIDKAWVRKNIGIVLQEPFLYAKTIRDNIKLANPNIQDKKVYESAKIASIHQDIKSFDKGYDTYVGERGVSLSGGQKQRVAIARTIINDCPIVVFDDSLSAVDTETDISIRKALNNRKNKSTTIIISHRISTVSEADEIIVLDNGRIIQRGNHEKLINEKGLYQRLYEIQNSMKDLEEDIKLHA
ncbi:ATP-binding cassette subfamily B protein [Keratinibaculum paraultunense]|uniref:ATP-binding cassette subfamily B protein n=2 Tax=Keratinibaculum paraultunense TaxID=1278232 RepID=A0A4R3KPM0_9FIRM|nr:ABC transporter ATP-binding protein [Keratinibaculum paraultunense]QQY79360.1 ABC transporter ATP-binding protein [Keratinibaculum paraultunense]TCS86620.1 ATP-binding cassette subfamily B protein [Keratinibaculum paraultunense]